MSEKIARLGIERDPDKMYYIKNGDVWAAPRKQPGKPKGKPTKIAAAGIDLDYSKYLYFVDGDGDVARKARGGGGGRSKAKTTAKAPKAPIATKTGKKTEAQLEQEINECLSKVKGAGYEVSDAPVVKRGGKKRGKKR